MAGLYRDHWMRRHVSIILKIETLSAMHEADLDQIGDLVAQIESLVDDMAIRQGGYR